jgi:hypothetical protein
MNIIAWVVPGLASGLFFSLSTWLTAIAGAAVLLRACHLASGRTGHRTAHR